MMFFLHPRLLFCIHALQFLSQQNAGILHCVNFFYVGCGELYFEGIFICWHVRII
jgi:hypothetical protein